MIPVKTKALGSPDGFSGTPKRAQETTLGLLLKGNWLETALGVRGAVKPLIIAEGVLQTYRCTGMQANGRCGGHVERLFTAGLGDAHMQASQGFQLSADSLPFVP